MDTILADIAYYQQSSLSASTLNTYSTAVNDYIQFCYTVSTSPFPLSEHLLQCYITNLARRVSYNTIKTYLAGIQYTSIMLGHNRNIAAMNILYYTLCDIRRVLGNKQKPHRQPFTITHIRAIFTYLNRLPLHPRDKLLLRSAVTLAFFGFFRSSEYTSPSQQYFDPAHTLLITDIRFSVNYAMAYINIKSSKTDPFKVGITLRVAAVGSDICPVLALLEFIRNCHHISDPLYTYNNGSYLTRSQLSGIITSIWPNANLNTHSFRIGGASCAAAADIADSSIKLLGRWSSNAYQRYIHVADETVTNFAIRISSVTHLNGVWNSETLSTDRT